MKLHIIVLACYFLTTYRMLSVCVTEKIKQRKKKAKKLMQIRNEIGQEINHSTPFPIIYLFFFSGIIVEFHKNGK